MRTHTHTHTHGTYKTQKTEDTSKILEKSDEKRLSSVLMMCV